MLPSVTIRDANTVDIPRITAIFDAIFDTTYEYTERRHTVAERSEWLAHQQAGGWPVLVAVDDGVVVGVASYGSFRDSEKWEGYRFTVELTIHVAESSWRRGVGRVLMEGLFVRCRDQGVRVIVAGIDSSNEQSIAFHSRLGFTETARMPGVGMKWGRALELVLMQRDVP